MAETLKFLWTDHAGKVWDLTSGAEGVILDLGQSGLGWSDISHVFARSGQRHMSATATRGIHHLAVLVGWNKVGQDFYDLREAWWFHANSPFVEGTLSVIRPDGETRSRRLRLAESPDTEYRYDPGLGLDQPVEPWVLTGNGPWWDGDLQTTQLSQADFTGGSDTPFYGEDGTAWPFHIASPAYAMDAFMSNRGQGPMWLTWELVGPLTFPMFGIPGAGVLSYVGSIMPGEVVKVTTDPETRGAVTLHDGLSKYSHVAGEYAPLPAGARVPLYLSAEGLSSGSRIIAYGTEKHASAF